MSSGIITDLIDCPQCGYPAQQENFYVSKEERVNCPYCGYTHLKTLEDTYVSKGYGSIWYSNKNEEKNGSNEIKITRLTSPISVEYRHFVITDIEEHYDRDKSNLFVWNDETHSLECLLGKKPLTLDEQYEEQKAQAEYYAQLMFSKNTCFNQSDFKEF